jgi:NAD(P)-dependent dehydrogenase (short-subunit alcohol dehydrogenase family)
MDLELTGKCAVVTGGSRGIGKQIARVLVEEGVRVAVVARNREHLDLASQELGPNAVPFICDTSQDVSVKSMVSAVLGQFGHVDILVNCAAQPGGQGAPPKLSEITDQNFWEDVNVKVMGYLRCIRELAPSLQAGARIVNVSGLLARQTGSIIGSVRNVGVAALTKNLADELGPRGISVIAVHPGVVRTEKTPDVIRKRAQTEGSSESAVLAELSSRNVLGRLIDATEVAYVVAFLSSPRAIAINGDAVVVGGGIPGSIYY